MSNEVYEQIKQLIRSFNANQFTDNHREGLISAIELYQAAYNRDIFDSSLRKGAEVAVKQIDWQDMTYKGVEEWVGHCALSQSFTIKDDGEGCLPYRFVVRPFLSGVTSFPTADEAKAAAQADYEARIRSALVSGSREEQS